MQCSCVILNYKDAARSKRLAQTLAGYACVRKVIVVDNCSPDDSLAELGTISDEKVSVLTSERNGGYGYGNNFGVHACLEDYDEGERALVLIANPDVMVSEEAVEAMIGCMESHEDSFACAPVQYDIHGERVRSTAWPLCGPVRYAATDSVILSRVLGMPRYDASFIDAEGDVRVDCIAGALLMVDARRFEEMGGYDEEVFLFCEETSIGLRASQHGWSTYLCRDERYDHEHSTSVGKELSSYLHHYKVLSDSRRRVLRHDYHVSGATALTCDVVLALSQVGAWVKAPLWALVRLVQR